MFKSILLSAVMLLLLACLTYSQTDIDPDTKFGVTDKYGITPEEEAVLNNQVNIERNIPQYLLDQVEQARINGNIEEMNRIQNIIDTKYNNGVYIVKSDQNQSTGIEPCYADNQKPPYNPDWMGTDVTVYSGTSSNLYTRPKALDMKLGEDGNMYIAMCVNRTGYRYIRVYRSTNSGLTWLYRGGLVNSASNMYFLSLSMLTERRHSYNNDSLRVCIYFTYGASSNNDDATLNYFSFKPNATSADYIIKTSIVDPPAGNEINFPCAISDGQYWTTATYMGCVAVEYNNAGTSLVKYHFLRTTNWGSSHTATTFDPGWPDKNLSAAFINKSTDSVYIAVERDMTTDQIRVITTRWSPTSAFFTRYLTSGGANTRPVISIQQTASNVTKKILIVGRKNNVAKYHNSLNGGSSWNLDYTLDPRNSPTTNWMWCSMDTNNSSGGYAIGIWADNDSLSVRRGVVGSLGTTFYKRNSSTVTGDALPVCAIYNNSGNFKRSAITYYGFGGNNVYYDGENLPTGITNTNGIANSYNLSQNFPNPFNPTTSINFSIPKDGLVKIVVYDVLGKEVATIVNSDQTTGNYQVTFDASKLNSGVYFYKITSGDFSDVKKMILVK